VTELEEWVFDADSFATRAFRNCSTQPEANYLSPKVSTIVIYPITLETYAYFITSIQITQKHFLICSNLTLLPPLLLRSHSSDSDERAPSLKRKHMSFQLMPSFPWQGR